MRNTFDPEMKLPHYGQILTNKETIQSFMGDVEHPVVMNTLYLLLEGVGDTEKRLRLYSVCSRLYYLSKLVYRDGEKIVKLSSDEYEKGLFEGYAEDKIDIGFVLSYWNDRHSDLRLNVTDELLDEVWEAFLRIKALWLRFIACRHEQIYIPEYAYALEYVYMHKGELPMPEYSNDFGVFPNNYKDFNCSEGIADYFEDIMDGLF